MVGRVPQTGQVRILRQLDDAELHPKRVIQKKAAHERFADPEYQLDRLGRLDSSDDPRQHAQHAAFGAARDEARRRWLGMQTSIAGTLRRREHRRLPLEARDAAVGIGPARQHAGIVDEIPRRKVVGAVDDDVVGRYELERVPLTEPHGVRFYPRVRVDLAQAIRGRVELRAPDVRRPVNDLALQIADVDGVLVHESDRADACRREIHRRG